MLQKTIALRAFHRRVRNIRRLDRKFITLDMIHEANEIMADILKTANKLQSKV